MTIRYEIIGAQPADGTTRRRWAFGDPECPLRLASTPTGLGGAPFKHSRQSNARQPGATWRGRVDEYNTIGLDVHIGPVPPAEAVELWSTWRASLGRGDRLAEFHTYSPAGGDRWQYVRLEQSTRDPGLDLLAEGGYAFEHVELGSDVAWWESAPIEQAYTLAEPAPATIRNHGDVPAWARWTVTGPGVFTLGLDGEAVTLPALAAGESWEIETDPEGPHVRDTATNTDRGDRLGVKAWFRPAAADRASQITATITGGTSDSRVELRLPQLWTVAAA